MQMYLLVGVMVLPKTVKITQNMFKAFLFAIALKGFLFAQGFEIKSFQVSASSNILNSDSLILKGAVGTTFNQKSSSDSLTLTGGFSKGLQGVYSEPPLISIETDTSNDIINKEDPVIYTAIATDVNGVLNSTLMIQLGGSEIPIEIPMTVINDSVFAAEVPESLLTVRNFRAWVVSEDSLLNEAISPYQKPEMQFAKSELSMNNRFSHYKDGIIPKKWRLVSWPGVLDDAKLKNSDLDNGYVFYDWDIQTNKWSEPDTIMPGKAYWFKHRYNKNASFSKIPNGCPGLETRLPLLFSDGVLNKKISINKFVEITSSKPAKIYGLYPRKGTIAIGSDADLVIWDTGINKTIKNKDLHHNVDYTPYENIKVSAWPNTVICRGKIIVSDGKLHGSKGFGEFQKSDISKYVY